MSSLPSIAIVGATGAVGEALVALLEERDFPLSSLYLLSSAESAGKSLPFRGKNLRVGVAETFDFKQVAVTFLAANQEVSQVIADRAFQAGSSIVDLSGALEASISPRVIPGVNDQVLNLLPKPWRVSIPCSPAAALVSALAPLCAKTPIEYVTVTACLPASGRGRAGVRELARQTTELLNGRSIEPRVFGRQLAFNILGLAGNQQENGYSQIERRLIEDSQHILGKSLGIVSATCIQVPVFYGESLAVTLKTQSALTIKELNLAYSGIQNLELFEADEYPTAVEDSIGRDETLIGRMRQHPSDGHVIEMWIVSDNVRRSAALNAIQTAELLIKHTS
ncbi:aspartate-semialdehyde dehydrogenase [Pseudomonas duriflava]|uniref:Aspartate-semialdehyde dehydrogenase n=1 Tax=Pseudomonas duriflava TaxID=459528 RepID=A0A562QAN8_9PSED|nr:aspartate-semialdehyde dehydrogenase [Pseudomonas duriflava]TWI53086.1 aspartate-semialdehyde dehydrogenase [Pseudomonas duriflava]